MSVLLKGKDKVVVDVPLRLRLRLSMRRLGASGAPHLPVNVKPKITRFVRIFLVHMHHQTSAKREMIYQSKGGIQNTVDVQHRRKCRRKKEETVAKGLKQSTEERVLTTGTQAPFPASYSSSSPLSSSNFHVWLCVSKWMRGSEANAAAWVSAEEPAARVDGVAVDIDVDDEADIVADYVDERVEDVT